MSTRVRRREEERQDGRMEMSKEGTATHKNLTEGRNEGRKEAWREGRLGKLA